MLIFFGKRFYRAFSSVFLAPFQFYFVYSASYIQTTLFARIFLRFYVIQRERTQCTNQRTFPFNCYYRLCECATTRCINAIVSNVNTYYYCDHFKYQNAIFLFKLSIACMYDERLMLDVVFVQCFPIWNTLCLCAHGT